MIILFVLSLDLTLQMNFKPQQLVWVMLLDTIGEL